MIVKTAAQFEFGVDCWGSHCRLDHQSLSLPVILQATVTTVGAVCYRHVTSSKFCYQLGGADTDLRQSNLLSRTVLLLTSSRRTENFYVGISNSICWIKLVNSSSSSWANRVCLACNSGAVGDEKHTIFECTALAPLRQQHANLFAPRTDSTRFFFAQQDHLGFLNYVVYKSEKGARIHCLNFMNI